MHNPLHEQRWRKAKTRRENRSDFARNGKDWMRHLYFSDLDEATAHASQMPGEGFKFVGITEHGWQPRHTKPTHPEAYYLCMRGKIPKLIEPWRKDANALKMALRVSD